jgi:hypothetical protein
MVRWGEYVERLSEILKVPRSPGEIADELGIPRSDVVKVYPTLRSWVEKGRIAKSEKKVGLIGVSGIKYKTSVYVLAESLPPDKVLKYFIRDVNGNVVNRISVRFVLKPKKRKPPVRLEDVVEFIRERTKARDPPIMKDVLNKFGHRYSNRDVAGSCLRAHLQQAWKKGLLIRYGRGGETGRYVKSYGYVWAYLDPRLSADELYEICEKKIKHITHSAEYSGIRFHVLRLINEASRRGELIQIHDLVRGIPSVSSSSTLSYYLKNILETTPVRAWRPKAFGVGLYLYNSDILKGERLRGAKQRVENMFMGKEQRKKWYGHLIEGVAMAALAEYYQRLYQARSELGEFRAEVHGGLWAQKLRPPIPTRSEIDILVKIQEPGLYKPPETWKDKSYVPMRVDTNYLIIECKGRMADVADIKEFLTRLRHCRIKLPDGKWLYPFSEREFSRYYFSPQGKIEEVQRFSDIRQDIRPIYIALGFSENAKECCFKNHVGILYFDDLLYLLNSVYKTNFNSKSLSKTFWKTPLARFLEGYERENPTRTTDLVRANAMIWLYESILNASIPSYVQEMIDRLKGKKRKRRTPALTIEKLLKISESKEQTNNNRE